MPKPQEGETRKKFIQRCIPIVLDEGTAEDGKQAAAICHSYWREAKGVKKTLSKSQYMPLRARKVDGEWRLEVLGVPFGGMRDGKDMDGEYFSARTDIHLKIGDQRPVYYMHGKDPDGQTEKAPPIIGKATYSRQDTQGHWFEVVLDKAKDYADRIWRAAIQGIAKASSGAINYLCRRTNDGEYLSWPVAELTLIDMGEGRLPANMLATVNLKAAFDELELDYPEAWQEVEDSTEADAELDEPQIEKEKLEETIAPIVATVVQRVKNERGK